MKTSDSLIGMIGLVFGKRNVFLLDSGASSNFMSLKFATEHGINV